MFATQCPGLQRKNGNHPTCKKIRLCERAAPLQAAIPKPTVGRCLLPRIVLFFLTKSAALLNFGRMSRNVILCTALLAASTGIFAKTPAQEMFEEAYNIEAQEPERAVRLYEQVLDTDLEDELRATVKWRLVYLYKRQKQFSKAFLLVESLGRERHTKTILAEIRREMVFHWDAQKAAVDHFLEGVRLLRRSPQDGGFLGRFRLALQAENPFLLQNIVDQLSRAGRGEEALQFLEAHGDNSSGHALLRSDLLFSLGRATDAESILRDLVAVDVSLATADKAQVLYLLGRMNANRKDYRKAVMYFRLAARYFDSETGHKI